MYPETTTMIYAETLIDLAKDIGAILLAVFVLYKILSHFSKDKREARKIAREERARQNGYDWAAGLLLRTEDEYQVEAANDKIDAATYGTYDYGPFDRGAAEAQVGYRNLTQGTQATEATGTGVANFTAVADEVITGPATVYVNGVAIGTSEEVEIAIPGEEVERVPLFIQSMNHHKESTKKENTHRKRRIKIR